MPPYTGSYFILLRHAGDTGDHGGDGSVKNIYVVEEPALSRSGDLDPIVTLHYRYQYCLIFVYLESLNISYKLSK